MVNLYEQKFCILDNLFDRFVESFQNMHTLKKLDRSEQDLFCNICLKYTDVLKRDLTGFLNNLDFKEFSNNQTGDELEKSLKIADLIYSTDALVKFDRLLDEWFSVISSSYS